MSAREDPTGLIRSLDRAVIDEIQRAPQLLLAIKKSVDHDQRTRTAGQLHSHLGSIHRRQSMGLDLQQGANAPLAQHRILVGIGWDAGLPWDIDACAFLIGAKGQVRHDQDFVFYNQAETPCGSLILESDPDNDRRCFRAFLDRVPEDVVKITFTVTLATEPDGEGCPHCGLLDQLYIRLTDLTGEDELIRFDLKPVGRERALMLGDLYRHQGTWKFRAVGQGYNGGLDTLATALGVNLQPSTVEVHEEPEDTPTLNPPVTLSRRRSPKQTWAEKAEALQKALRRFLPQIQAAVDNQINESNTRMILDKILMDVFGYSMDEIKAEQKVQGRKAISYKLRDWLSCQAESTGA